MPQKALLTEPSETRGLRESVPFLWSNLVSLLILFRFEELIPRLGIRERLGSGKASQCLAKEYAGSRATTSALVMRFALDIHFRFRKRMLCERGLIR